MTKTVARRSNAGCESDLTDVELAALMSALEFVLSHLGIGVCGTEWGKQLGGGLFEFRIRHEAPSTIGNPSPTTSTALSSASALAPT